LRKIKRGIILGSYEKKINGIFWFSKKERAATLIEVVGSGHGNPREGKEVIVFL